MEASDIPAGRLRVAAFQTAAKRLVVPAFGELALAIPLSPASFTISKQKRPCRCCSRVSWTQW